MKKLSSKIIAGLMAVLIGLSPSLGTKASAAETENATSLKTSEKNQDKTVIQKFKDWVSSHKLVSGTVSSGSVLLTALIVAYKSKPQYQWTQVQLQTLDKNGLLEILPSLWQNFCAAARDAGAAYAAARDPGAARDAGAAARVAYDAARAAAGAAVYDAAWAAAYDAARDAGAAYDDAYYAAYYAAYHAAYDAAFANAWRRDGAAYDIVKDNDIVYFQNLTTVLAGQINILENIVR